MREIQKRINRLELFKYFLYPEEAMKAKEIMTKDVLTANPTTQAKLATQVLVIKKISGLPVVDDDNNLIGIFSEKDAMRLLLEHSDELEKKVVEDYMSTQISGFGPEDEVEEIKKNEVLVKISIFLP